MQICVFVYLQKIKQSPCRHTSLRPSWVDPMFTLPRWSLDRLVAGHLALRHGAGRHPLREGRADLQRRGQLPPRRVDGVPGADPRLPSHPTPRPAGPAWPAPPPLGHLLNWRRWWGDAEKQRCGHIITPRAQVLFSFLERIGVACHQLPSAIPQ